MAMPLPTPSAHVTDVHGNPLSGIWVGVKADNFGQAYTDDNGHYSRLDPVRRRLLRLVQRPQRDARRRLLLDQTVYKHRCSNCTFYSTIGSDPDANGSDVQTGPRRDG